MQRDVRGGRDQQMAWGATGSKQQQGGGRLPPHVVHKALQNPSVQNLARSLAYHRACLQELPLEQAAAGELVQLVLDMGAALQTVLAL